ncbi:MAG TPA: ATP-binding protein [Alphaproteobacteria bacterium]|nr:ATP-binding protein [Alphaproteobacteria bacterium]
MLAILTGLSCCFFALSGQAQEQTVNQSVLQDINVEFDRTPDKDVSNTRSLILSDAYKEHFLSAYITQYEDSLNTMSAKQIIRASNINGEPPKNSRSIFKVNSKGIPVWISFDVMNRSSQTEWKVDFGNSFMGRFGLLDDVTAYVFNKTTRVLKKREITSDGSITFDLPIDQKSQIIIRLKSKTGLPVTTPLRLIHQNQDLSTQGGFFFSASLTALIGMAFFFLAIALLRNHIYYLIFSLYYLLFAGLLVVQNTFVISNVPVIGGHFIPLIFLLISLCGMMTARIFWNLHEKPQVVDILFWGIIGLSIASFLVGLFLPIQMVLIKYILLFGPSLFITALIPVVSVIMAQGGNSEVSAFMFGWFILLFGAFITLLSLTGIVPTVSTAMNALWITLIPQAFFFAMAVKIKFAAEFDDVTMSRTLEIDESESVSKLRQSKENTEQDRLLKVIEQERKVLGELRKSEARRSEEMRIAKEEADQANAAKSAFLAVVSHEIRTPMTGIMGMVKLLMGSSLTKEQKEFARTIQDSSDAMLALLNDILDFEKIEQGKMALENISFDLHQLIQGVATLMNGHAVQKNIELRIKIGENLPQFVKGDPTRLRQVLLNLTGNSVKFTNEGHVTITAELMDENIENDKCKIYFGISDTGVGISKEGQEKLFKPFSQADSSVSRKFGGTGLGLAISKGLVENMGSTINISSNLGEGSTFFFTLEMPVGQNDTLSDRKAAQQAIKEKPMSILVVEDNEINQKVVAGFLEKSPYTLTMAGTATDALQKIESNKFDLVLMDIELPDMKGDEATRKIRSSNNQSIKNLPVIALTGNMMPQDIERFYNAGMNGALAKPIDIDMLISTIKKAGEGVFDNPSFGMKTPLEVAPDKNAPPPQQKEEEQTKPAQQNAPPEETAIITPSSESQGVFDHGTLDSLKTHISNDDMKEMLNDVIVKSDEIIRGMNEALVKNKTEDLSARAHELKGMAGNFGLLELSGQASLIEKKAKVEAPIVLAGLLDPLPEMQNRAKMALHQWLDSNG